MRFSTYLFILLLVVLPNGVHAEEINAGFVQGLWYSSDQILEGVPVRVYAALRNNSPHDLIGTVRFIDNGKRIGSSPVSALSGRLVETWIDWTPSTGEHSLSVSLSDAELHVIGGEVIQVDVANIIVTDTLTADYDTDNDGTGNMTDTDDDNDGVSDTDEVAHGSNSLVANPKAKEITEEVKEVEKIESETSYTPSETEAGLEQFLEDGTIDTLLANVTNKVETAKQSLDTYRAERNEQIANERGSSTSTASNGTSTGDMAITRSQIENNNAFLSSFVQGAASLLQNIWTFILWILSHVLAHPAIIQLVLLLSILFGLYRIVRRVGRRPS